MTDVEMMSVRNMQVIRILKEIRLLEGRPDGLTVKEIHKRLQEADIECSERTVFRDLEAIRDAHFPITHESDGDRNIWRFDSVAVISDKVRISLPELKALYLSREFLEPLRGSNFFNDIKSFYDKLEKLLGAKALAELTDISKALGFKPKASWGFGVPQEVMDVLYAGCNEGHKIHIEYQSTSGERAFKTTKRLVGPETLYLADAGLYLIAKDFSDGKTKTFSVPRIRSAEWTDEGYDTDGFDVKKHFEKSMGVFNSGTVEKIEIFIREPIASYVAERKWHESQKILRKSDGVLLTLDVRINDELARWILSLGPQAKVLSPPNLAEMVRSQAADIVEGYLRKVG